MLHLTDDFCTSLFLNNYFCVYTDVFVQTLGNGVDLLQIMCY